MATWKDITESVMVDYNDGKWHGWNGGECPVHPETIVEGIYFDPEKKCVDHRSPVGDRAICFDWTRDGCLELIAFRVIKEHKEPREFWTYFDKDIQRWCFSDNKMTATHRNLVSGVTGDVIHLREVLP